MSKAITIVIALVILAAIGYYAITESQRPAMEATSASEASTSSAQMAGTWRSTDDAKFTRTFSADGTVTDRYEGDDSATDSGPYAIVDPNTVSDLPVQASALAGMTVIKADFAKTGTMYFSINALTATSLQMTYLGGRGGLLSFTRVQ